MGASYQGTRAWRADAAERERRAMLQRIDSALARIEAGEYGWCAVCGEQIATARLDQEPTTAYCVACAGLARPADR